MQIEYSVEVKEMTPKQEDLLKEILDSEELSDSESRSLKSIFRSRVSTSEDASVLISHVLALLKFRRHFGED
jgi:hypothetical protein